MKKILITALILLFLLAFGIASGAIINYYCKITGTITIKLPTTTTVTTSTSISTTTQGGGA